VPRRPRSALGDGIFHVTARGTNRAAIFFDDSDRRTFMTLLGRVVHTCEWTCHAFCLMTNHYHLITETTFVRLSSGMHALNGRYARYFNERHNRDGHLFKGRYGAYLIESEEHLAAARECILANPVRAGLCAGVADWPWSGCPSLLSARS
jgi:REP element-mobilizing transposase RayT